MRHILITILFLLICPLLAVATVHDFKDYPAKNPETLKKAFIKPKVVKELKNIKLSNGLTAWHYVKKKPNFAYHYEVVEWSCGLPCRQSTIINLATGESVGDIDSCYGLKYRINSTLLMEKANKDDTLESCSKEHYHILKDEKITKIE